MGRMKWFLPADGRPFDPLGCLAVRALEGCADGSTPARATATPISPRYGLATPTGPALRPAVKASAARPSRAYRVVVAGAARPTAAGSDIRLPGM